ncbi:hypothetical protein SDC9_78121 [bioreactor metagenome]|uniref:DNA methylase N-4/N-6 domain-containing protein n=1 Tax=bioreactor metagenome TaxID=1076179 RepID=A0A644YSK4_9ZZZZ
MNEQLTFEFTERPTIKGFPELRWTGKRPYRSTQYYPAQLRERYVEDVQGWINKIFWGDNLQVMSHLLKEYRGQVDLIYIDPPFDSKADYKKTIEIRGNAATSDASSFEEKQYGDIWTNDEYLQFMYERLTIMLALLKNTGNIVLHCDWHRQHQLRCVMDEVFGQENFHNEIIYCYSGGGIPKTEMPRKHDNLLWYSKGSSWTFNTQYRAYSEGTLQRGRTAVKGENAALRDEGTPLNDWWTDVKKITSPTDPEKLYYPTQKSEELLSRVVTMLSNPGDLVFDCFMGSGTTQAVAMKLGRRFIGADINLGAIQTTTKRLISVATELQAEAQPQLTIISGGKKSVATDDDNDENYLIAASAGYSSDADKATTSETKYTGFEVYNVNNYDFFRNPVEARDLLIEALEVQPFPQSDVWDGELDGRMVKIMPVNRIATKADLEELKANLPYKTYEKRKEEDPSKPVEKITIVCMGHEPDLKAALEADIHEYKFDIEIVDILRDKADLQLKREAEAEIVREGGKLVIRSFYPLNLMQKLSLQKEYVEDWRQLVESVMIDWNYDGAVMQPTVTDVPGKKDMVSGIYDIPSDAGSIKVKITDLLSESLEVEVR